MSTKIAHIFLQLQSFHTTSFNGLPVFHPYLLAKIVTETASHKKPPLL